MCVLQSADAVLVRGAGLAALAAPFNRHVIDVGPITAINVACQRALRFRVAAPRKLVFVGTVSARKGIFDVLDILRNCIAVRGAGAYRLVVAGDGEDLNEARDYARRLGMEEGVDFIGFVDSPDVLGSVWDGASAALVMTRNAEGFPRVIDEAFCMGVPVITTGTGGIRGELGNGAAVYVKGTVEDRAAATMRLCEDKQFRASVLREMKVRRHALRSRTAVAIEHLRAIGI